MSSNPYPCPVCGALHVTDYIDRIEGVVCECAEHCPNGCMEYEFAYGMSRERVGDVWWEWHHTETVEEQKKRSYERADVINRLRAEMNKEEESNNDHTH